MVGRKLTSREIRDKINRHTEMMMSIYDARAMKKKYSWKHEYDEPQEIKKVENKPHINNDNGYNALTPDDIKKIDEWLDIL